MEDGDVVDRLMIASRQLLTVSSAGKYLRSWSMRDGSLLWELVTYTAAAPSADAKAERDRDRGVDVLPLGADIDGDGDEDLLMLSRGEVQLRSLSEGVAAWSTEAAEAFDETVRLHRVARDPTTGKIIAFGVTEDDGSPAAIEMDPKTGEVTRKGDRVQRQRLERMPPRNRPRLLRGRHRRRLRIRRDRRRRQDVRRGRHQAVIR